MVEEQDGDDGAGDTAIGYIKHGLEEEAIARSILDEREIEHIYNAAIHPAGIAPYLTIEDAVDDIAQRTGNDESHGSYIARASRLLMDQEVRIVAQRPYRHDAEEREQQLAEPLNTKGHTIILHIADIEPWGNLHTLTHVKVCLDINLDSLVDEHCQEDNARDDQA